MTSGYSSSPPPNKSFALGLGCSNGAASHCRLSLASAMIGTFVPSSSYLS